MKKQSPDTGNKEFSPQDLSEFKDILERKLSTAKSELKYLMDHIAKNTEAPEKDLKNLGKETEQWISMRDRQNLYISKLEASLIRIQVGNYGHSRISGKLIEKERLLAVPYTMITGEEMHAGHKDFWVGVPFKTNNNRADAKVKSCRICGCTDHDCRQCIAKTGSPCHWVEEDLCSACVPESQKDYSLSKNNNMAIVTAGSKTLNKPVKNPASKPSLGSLVVFLPMTSIHPSKTNPRKSFEKENIKDLADSMTTVGLLSPITVRPAGDKYEIVAGERRFMAAKLLKWENISCISRAITDDEMLEIQIIENLQREDVSPMDEAAAFKTLLKKESIEWLASKIHKTKKYIIDRLKLNELIKEAEQYVQKGILPLGHAVVISKLSFADQKQCLQKCINNCFGANTDDDYCKMPLEELKDFIADDIMLEFKKVNFDTDDATLYPMAGSCTTCPKRTCNSNLLFDDITKEDKCTDTACFHEKINLHVTREKSRAKETYGKVLAGERDGYSGSGSIKVQGVTLKYTETPGKNSVPVVLTKTDRFNKNTLGATVFVDSKLLEHSKKAKEEQKTERKESGGNDYEAGRKKEFTNHTWPRLQKIAEGLPFNEEILIEYFRQKFSEYGKEGDTMALAGIMGYNGFAKTPEQAWEQREGYSHGFKKEIFDKIISHMAWPDLIMLDMFLDHVDDDEDDEIDHEEEFGFSWKELMEHINPKPALEKKNSKAAKK